ncbi:cadmium-containing carbonic anhydrase [Patescibacteria group bacterium]|nr:cadmium-containing carbonic anhydrase [Patescibacteria group bacterium]
MTLEFKTHPSYSPGKVADFFEGRNWKVEYVRVSNEDLVEVAEGLATECIDGRFGKHKKRQQHGPKLPGGVYSIAALKTGGNAVGFNEAAVMLRRLGYRPGTHDHCGFFAKWRDGELVAVRHKLELEEKLVVMKHRQWEGVHFGIPDEHREHEEDALTFNPYIGLTSKARKDRFGYDHGFMQSLGIPGRRAMHLAAETVEKLSHSRRVEILVR